MCGICGVLQHGQAVPDRVGSRMLATLAHRGPDNQGIASYGSDGQHVLFASSRLAIIDLSPAGHQPMVSEDGRTAIVHNGEIYNFSEHREELHRRGHVFRSRTDTEVVLHGYEEFGLGVFPRLDGMFACAIWDGRSRKLLLARDRWGKKPLYYYLGDGMVVFASEIKAILAHPDVSAEFNSSVLPGYIVHGYIQPPDTFYLGIRQVPPASVVEFHADGALHVIKYWELRFPSAQEEVRISVEEAAEALRSLVREAVRKRLISDVPLGALLSGGLDSSVIVSTMAEVSNAPVQTFTAGFEDDPSYDERGAAKEIATAYGTMHTEFLVRMDDVPDLVDKLLWHHDQPYGDSSAIPTYLICGLARQHVTVALVGDGGDEAFGGYERFRAALLAERLPRPMASAVGAALRRLPHGTGYHSRLTRLRRFGMGLGASLGQRYLNWVAVTPPGLARTLLADGLSEGVLDVQADVDLRLRRMAASHPLHRLMHLNFETYLPGDLLVKMDRMSMAQSLETRSPLLDTALVEFVVSLPAQFKIQGNRQKALLRQAFADRLPRTVLHRPKHGFGVPLDDWFRGPLRLRVMDELLAEDARVAGFLRPTALAQLVREHMSGRENHGHRLWTILNLELWLRAMPRWRQELLERTFVAG